MRLYLTGPITGKTSNGIHSWRMLVRAHFYGRVDIVDPSEVVYDSSVAHLTRETSSKALKRLQHGRFVVARNQSLIKECDLLLANFLEDGGRTSIGSVAEIAWASALSKAIFIVRGPEGSQHDHAMLNGMATVIVHTLEEALEKIDEFAGLKERLVQKAAG